MTRKPDDMRAWLALAGTLLAAGIWLGTLQNRITQLERTQVAYHGDPALTKEK